MGGTVNRAEQLLKVAAELGSALAGLVVSHRGRTMTLTGFDGQWEATTLAEPEHCEEHDVQGFGATPDEALDSAADEADLVEQGEDAEDGDEDE